jgi:hypothetical protein
MKILIGCDVDPVLPAVLDRRPQGDIWECLDRIGALAGRMGNALPRITWLIRADQSVEFSSGSLASGYASRRGLWDGLHARGHELGWHMHLMSYSAEHGQFVFDPDPSWLGEAHEQIARCFPVHSTRTGWDYGSSTLLAALDRLGVTLDFSALPGSVAWFSVGRVKLRSDWRACPAVPYHPSRSDYQCSGSDALSLWEVPVAQFRRPLAASVMRAGWRLRHGYLSSAGVQKMTRVLTDEWPDLPLPADSVWAFFFHPYDLSDAGISNFGANVRRLEDSADAEFVTASEIARWLSAREQASLAEAGDRTCSRS